MTEWSRNDSTRLGEIASQVGLSPEEAERAITLGARFIALGYSDEDVNDMESDYRRLMRLSWERWGR